VSSSLRVIAIPSPENLKLLSQCNNITTPSKANVCSHIAEPRVDREHSRDDVGMTTIFCAARRVGFSAWLEPVHQRFRKLASLR
jgi:hypothetical protein